MVSKPASLYQQTRLNLDPTDQSSVVDISIPSNATFLPSRSSPKRRRIERKHEPFDENAFSRLCLASEADIYFRPHKEFGKKRKQNPSQLRSVLWRILEDRTCLELQSVDLTQDEKLKEPLLTLRLSFDNKIRAGGVALAEASDETGDKSHETPLVLCVVTTAGELFTITLTRDMFVKQTVLTEKALRDWCQTHQPSAFTYRTPFRMLVKNDREVWFSLSDGALLKLERASSEPGSKWRETFFTEGVWKASLKGLIPWKGQKSMRYGDEDLDLSTATSIALSPDGKIIWTVCLDHTLKAWSIETGKTVVHKDLADDSTRDLQSAPDYIIDPIHSKLLRIHTDGNAGGYMVVTFSPKFREFKFWTIEAADPASHTSTTQCYRPELRLVPPIEDLADATVWTLEQFYLESRSHPLKPTLWLSIRSGANTHVFNVSFDLNATASVVQKQWSDNWAVVEPSRNTADALKLELLNPADLDSSIFFTDPEAMVEKWLKFLFYPGRFTLSTLETALVVYQNGIGRRSRQSRNTILASKLSLAQRVCLNVGASVALGLTPNDSVLYDRFSKDIAAQWQMFYGVVSDLHKRREVSLALAYDTLDELPWLVMTDCISPIRQSSDVELLWYNRDSFARPEEVKSEKPRLKSLSGDASDFGSILHIVDLFRDSFSKSFLSSFQSSLKAQILQSSAIESKDPIREIYDQCGFESQVSDEDYNNLTDAIDEVGGFEALSNSVFAGVLGLLGETPTGHHQKKQLTKYGVRTLLRGAQETLQLGQDVLLDLLLLVVFMSVELDKSDLAEDFDASRVFTALINKAKQHSLLIWLSDNMREELVEHDGEATAAEDLMLDKKRTSVTLLESLFVGDWSKMAFPTRPQLALLTYWCRAWVFGPNLSQDYDGITTYIMGNLLKNADLDLANDFLPYLPAMPWATYLRARLCLARNENVEAALYFKQAAGGLSTGKFFDLEQYDRADLLDADEREQFNVGLQRYYKHVSTLFESTKTISYVADFAQLALESPPHRDDGDDELESLRSDLLTRLFDAALHTSQYNLAYDAITQYPSGSALDAALHALTAALISSGRTQLLLSLPFTDALVDQVDAVLSAIVDKALHTTTSTAPAVLPRTVGAGALPISDFWKVLYAWRIQQDNFRGAAAVLWARLQVLKSARDTEQSWDELGETYLLLINVLSLVDERWSWILVRPTGGKQGLRLSAQAAQAEKAGKRVVVTLADVRREWQEELDRRAEIEAGRFAFVGGFEEDGDGMEVDVFA